VSPAFELLPCFDLSVRLQNESTAISATKPRADFIWITGPFAFYRSISLYVMDWSLSISRYTIDGW